MEKKSSECRAIPEAQMEALTALCDTLLPYLDVSKIHHQQQPLDQSVLDFYHRSASMAKTPRHVAVFVWEKIKHPKIFLAKLAMWLLSIRIGTFLLCGRESLSVKFPYLQRFSEIRSEKRERIVQSWSHSQFFLLRLLFTAFKTVTLLTFFTQVNERNENPSWKAIGYCGPDPSPNRSKNNTLEHQDADDDDQIKQDNLFGPLHKGIINFLQLPIQTALHNLQNSGFPVSIPCSADAKIGPFKPSFILTCDAVVIGSGPGGGLVAGLLAQAGHKVLVLEKGNYFARSNLSLLEGEALDRMYLGHGLVATDDMDVLILAGSTVGGGSTVNWSASIRTPPHVTKEWRENHGLELFGSKEYEQALDVVCDKMGVQTGFEHESFDNMILRKGCRNLGYPVEDIPRNAPPNHYCGWCCLGCKDGAKKGTSETWLVDMVESGNGILLPGCEAIKVIVNNTIHGRKRAVGVMFEFQGPTGKETGIIQAKVTVAACGAISTPGLLKRSELTNPNIGQNLHLHPVVFAWGYFPDGPEAWPEAGKTSYEGGIMTAMSRDVANPDKSGYDVIIQTPSLHPGLFSIAMPWHSGQDFKSRMLKFSRTAHVFALARDIGSGVVKSEHNLSYELDNLDKINLRQGVEKVLRILAAAGAEEVGTHHRDGRVLRIKESSPEEFERFVKEESSRPLTGQSTRVCSAHQMGSCRMGVDPKASAVGPTGETWEVKGLFVADSSVFPTALGVNPMVTVQAVAYCIGQSVLEFLGKTS